MWGGGAIMDSLCRVRLHYRVCSVKPIPIEKISSNLTEMFTSTRGCAEAMLPMCQLKVTIEGQISNNQLLNIITYANKFPYIILLTATDQ